MALAFHKFAIVIMIKVLKQQWPLAFHELLLRLGTFGTTMYFSEDRTEY